jgi:hypothetical protein
MVGGSAMTKLFCQWPIFINAGTITRMIHPPVNGNSPGAISQTMFDNCVETEANAAADAVRARYAA